MIVVDLPYGKLYVCKICGDTATSVEKLRSCTTTIPHERSEYDIGDEVELFDNAWQPGKKGVEEFTALRPKPERWKITGLFYGKRDFTLPIGNLPGAYLAMTTHQPPSSHHRLFVHLIRHEAGTPMTMFRLISYEEMKLRQGGNPEVMESAGLIRRR